MTHLIELMRYSQLDWYSAAKYHYLIKKHDFENSIFVQEGLDNKCTF